MDILASIFAYVVCMTGLLTGLIMSFAVFFSTPSPQAQAPTGAIAMVATPGSSTAGTQFAAKEFPVKTVAKAQQTDARSGMAAANAAAVQVVIAADAQQKPLLSQSRMRRLAEKARARHLAYRERSSFETRFLHYDD